MPFKNWFKKNSFLILVIGSFLAINIVFNFNIWKEIIVNNQNSVVMNDSTIAEFALENYYQNILHFKNPFIIEHKVIYPFIVNMSLNDPGITYLTYVFLLRPFFNIHQTLLIILLLTIFIANLSMFVLLKKLEINKYISLIMALSFGYTQFISYEILGHYTYTTIYFFPVLFLLLLILLKNKDHKKKLLLSIIFGVFMALGLLQNFYYFVGAVLGLISFLTYYFITSRRILLKIILKYLRYFCISGVIFLIFLIPWFYAISKAIIFESSEKISSIYSSIFYSADLVGWFTPSEYNPFYHALITKLAVFFPFFSKYDKFYLNNGIKIIFPGILILSIYTYLIIFYKKLSTDIKQKINPYFVISFFFALLLLGPFLKIFNRWSLPVDDGIQILFPLPFLIFHYIPVINDLRAPTRFLPIFIFLASLVIAYFLHFIYLKSSKTKQKLIIISLIFIFFIDQYYILPARQSTEIPKKAYNYIKNDFEKSTVLEIPFTLRDGYQYTGFVHALSPINGSLIHDKAIMGGYLARIPSSVFNYYKNLPFISYISQIIDKGNYNPLKEKPKEISIIPFSLNINEVKKELDFFDIKYVLLKNDEKYSSIIAKILTDGGFNQKMNDGKYNLYERNLMRQNFTNVKFGDFNDYLYTASGFSIREDGFRWTEGKTAKIFVKTYNMGNKNMVFNAASFYEPQEVEVYLNENYLGNTKISTDNKQYAFNISNKLKSGINTVIFRFSKSFKPSKVLPNNKDERNLALKFYSLEIK